MLISCSLLLLIITSDNITNYRLLRSFLVTVLILLARYDGDAPSCCPTSLLASWMLTHLKMSTEFCYSWPRTVEPAYLQNGECCLCVTGTQIRPAIFCAAQKAVATLINTLLQAWQSVQAFFNSPDGIYLFFSLVLLNILTSTVFCGQKWEEFISSFPALLIPFCCRYWLCCSVPAVCKVFVHKVCHHVALSPSMGTEALGGSFAPTLLSLPISRDAFLFCLCCCSALQAQGVSASGAEATACLSQPVSAKLGSALAGLQTEVLWLFCTWWK